MIAGLATIGTGTAIENSKTVKEDVVEEHNGVYGGKWHIVSPEGFELSEGLEYLKNSWEGDKDFGNYRYLPTLRVSGLPLDMAIEKLNDIFGLRNEILRLEMFNCTEANTEFRFRGVAVRKSVELKIHNCVLAFNILRDIVLEVFHENTIIDLSGNLFKKCKNDDSYLKELKHISEKNWHSMIKELNMMNCNFSDEEKNLLKTKLKSYPLKL